MWVEVATNQWYNTTTGEMRYSTTDPNPDTSIKVIPPPPPEYVEGPSTIEYAEDGQPSFPRFYVYNDTDGSITLNPYWVEMYIPYTTDGMSYGDYEVIQWAHDNVIQPELQTYYDNLPPIASAEWVDLTPRLENDAVDYFFGPDSTTILKDAGVDTARFNQDTFNELYRRYLIERGATADYKQSVNQALGDAPVDWGSLRWDNPYATVIRDYLTSTGVSLIDYRGTDPDSFDPTKVFLRDFGVENPDKSLLFNIAQFQYPQFIDALRAGGGFYLTNQGIQWREDGTDIFGMAFDLYANIISGGRWGVTTAGMDAARGEGSWSDFLTALLMQFAPDMLGEYFDANIDLSGIDSELAQEVIKSSAISGSLSLITGGSLADGIMSGAVGAMLESVYASIDGAIEGVEESVAPVTDALDETKQVVADALSLDPDFSGIPQVAKNVITRAVDAAIRGGNVGDAALAALVDYAANAFQLSMNLENTDANVSAGVATVVSSAFATIMSGGNFESFMQLANNRMTQQGFADLGNTIQIYLEDTFDDVSGVKAKEAAYLEARAAAQVFEAELIGLRDEVAPLSAEYEALYLRQDSLTYQERVRFLFLQDELRWYTSAIESIYTSTDYQNAQATAAEALAAYNSAYDDMIFSQDRIIDITQQGGLQYLQSIASNINPLYDPTYLAQKAAADGWDLVNSTPEAWWLSKGFYDSVVGSEQEANAFFAQVWEKKFNEALAYAEVGVEELDPYYVSAVYEQLKKQFAEDPSSVMLMGANVIAYDLVQVRDTMTLLGAGEFADLNYGFDQKVSFGTTTWEDRVSGNAAIHWDPNEREFRWMSNTEYAVIYSFAGYKPSAEIDLVGWIAGESTAGTTGVYFNEVTGQIGFVNDSYVIKNLNEAIETYELDGLLSYDWDQDVAYMISAMYDNPNLTIDEIALNASSPLASITFADGTNAQFIRAGFGLDDATLLQVVQRMVGNNITDIYAAAQSIEDAANRGEQYLFGWLGDIVDTLGQAVLDGEAYQGLQLYLSMADVATVKYIAENWGGTEFGEWLGAISLADASNWDIKTGQAIWLGMDGRNTLSDATSRLLTEVVYTDVYSNETLQNIQLADANLASATGAVDKLYALGYNIANDPLLFLKTVAVPEIVQEIGQTIDGAFLTAALGPLGAFAATDLNEAYFGTYKGTFDQAYQFGISHGMTETEADLYGRDIASGAAMTSLLINVATYGFDQAAELAFFKNLGLGTAGQEITSGFLNYVRQSGMVIGGEMLQEGFEEGIISYYTNVEFFKIDNTIDISGNVAADAAIGAIVGGLSAGTVYTGSILSEFIADNAGFEAQFSNASFDEQNAFFDNLMSLGFTEVDLAETFDFVAPDRFTSSADVYAIYQSLGYTPLNLDVKQFVGLGYDATALTGDIENFVTSGNYVGEVGTAGATIYETTFNAETGQYEVYFPPEVLNRADTNDDGFISTNEQSQYLLTYDLDGNGEITDLEATAKDAGFNTVADYDASLTYLGKYDLDGDGTVTDTEVIARDSGYTSVDGYIAGTGDFNLDGTVSRAEGLAHSYEYTSVADFKADYDLDSDGIVRNNEMAAVDAGFNTVADYEANLTYLGKYDLDGDGTVTDVEVTAKDAGFNTVADFNADVEFKATYDLDNDGTVTPKEQVIVDAGYTDEAAYVAETGDLNVDGVIDSDEQTAPDTGTDTTTDPSDYNGDGTVSQTEADAYLAQQMAAGLIETDLRYDINGDGIVTSADTLAIMQGAPLGDTTDTTTDGTGTDTTTDPADSGTGTDTGTDTTDPATDPVTDPTEDPMALTQAELNSSLDLFLKDLRGDLDAEGTSAGELDLALGNLYTDITAALPDVLTKDDLDGLLGDIKLALPDVPTISDINDTVDQALIDYGFVTTSDLDAAGTSADELSLALGGLLTDIKAALPDTTTDAELKDALDGLLTGISTEVLTGTDIETAVGNALSNYTFADTTTDAELSKALSGLLTDIKTALPDTTTDAELKDALGNLLTDIKTALPTTLTSTDIETAVSNALGAYGFVTTSDLDVAGTSAEELAAALGTAEGENLLTEIKEAIGDDVLTDAEYTSIATAVKDILPDTTTDAELKTAVDTITGKIDGLSSAQDIADTVETTLKDYFVTTSDLDAAGTSAEELAAALGLAENENLLTEIKEAISDSALSDAEYTGIATAVKDILPDTTTDAELTDALNTLFTDIKGELLTGTDVETAVSNVLNDYTFVTTSDLDTAGTSAEELAAALGTTEGENLLAEIKQAIGDDVLSDAEYGTITENLKAILPDTTTDAELEAAVNIITGKIDGLSSAQDIADAVETTLKDYFITTSDLDAEATSAEELAAALGLSGDENVVAVIQQAIDDSAGDTDDLINDLSDKLGTSTDTIVKAISDSQDVITGALGDTEDAIIKNLDALSDKVTDYEDAGIKRDDAIDLAISDLSDELGLAEDTIVKAIDLQTDTLKGILSDDLDILLRDIGLAEDSILGAVDDSTQLVSDLIGKPATEVTQADIDLVTDLIATGAVTSDQTLLYDVTGDQQITQADLDLMIQLQQDPTLLQDLTTSQYAATGLTDVVTDLNLDTQQQIDTGFGDVQDVLEGQGNQVSQQNFTNMLMQSGIFDPRKVNVRAPDPARINYVYNFDDIFATPQQAGMFVSPYGASGAQQTQQAQQSIFGAPLFSEGGQVRSIDEWSDEDELMRLIGGA